MKMTEHQIIEIEFFRSRPGLLTDCRDGSSARDGIYKVIKAALDFLSKESGKDVILRLEGQKVLVRAYGVGITDPEEQDRILFGPAFAGMMDAENYVRHRRSYYYNGFPAYFINILSADYTFTSFHDGLQYSVNCHKGILAEEKECPTKERNGVELCFTLDSKIFKDYSFNTAHVIQAIKYTVARHEGLRVSFDGELYHYEDGLLGLLKDEVGEKALYEPIHLCEEGIELAFTHIDEPVTEIVSFCNTVHTWDGGSHVNALEDVLPRYLKTFLAGKLSSINPMNGLICYFGINLLDMMFGNGGDTVYAEHMWEYDSDFNKNSGNKITDEVESFMNLKAMKEG